MKVALQIALLLVLLSTSESISAADTCTVKKMEVERLPDLNVPRSGHSIVMLDGEVTVIGGHTTNFIPTATLEYYKDGKWHLVNTAFTHDDGFAIALSTGKVLIAGGHEKNMGIGQSYEAELYDPVTHSSTGFASLDIKRSMASALELDSGRVVIAGNWYEKDGIELFDGQRTFSKVKDVAAEHHAPYILRTAKDDAIIVGGYDTRGDTLKTSLADRLKGEAYNVPLLEAWWIPTYSSHLSTDVSFIGDAAKGLYTYLLPIKNQRGEMAIAKVRNGEFSLLKTDSPIPLSCEWGEIFWCTPVLADKQHQKGYLIGVDSDFQERQGQPYRFYILTIDYATEPAGLTLGYTDPLEGCDGWNPVLTPDGNLMMIGGLFIQNNFQPSAAVWLIHLGDRSRESGVGSQETVIGLGLWPWLVLAFVILAIGAVWMVRRKESGVRKQESGDRRQTVDSVQNQTAPESELMLRISKLMESQRLFLNPDLKLSDVATALGTNRNYISDCINRQRGCSFTQFVNTYRVEHAKMLLRSQPDMKITEVCMASGFASENTFFRIFKAQTGKTPSEYKA